MSETFTQIFSKIPQDQINIAIQCGVLLGTASSIFYLFFGRLLSIPELIGVTLKNPTCIQLSIQPPLPGIQSLSLQDSSSFLLF